MEGRHEQRRRPFHQIPRLPYPPLGITTPTAHTLAGQKRDNAGYIQGPIQGTDLKQSENSKLFVTSIPKNIAEDEVRGVFAEHGNVLELALIKDKRTGIQQGFCFVKYSSREEAERAIRALHNQRTLPGGTSTLQVRFADEDRERSSSVEHKLFVGSLDKQATEKEIELIFAPYGRVDDVYIIRDDQGQSKGCSFVRFATKEMGMAAIKGLNGVYKMPGCTQPMTVRFADPKRPRSGDTRVGGPSFGGPGFSPRSGQGSAAGPTRVAARSGGPDNSRLPPFGWRPSDNPSFGPPQAHPHSFSMSRSPNEMPEGMQGAAKGTAYNSQQGLHQQTNEQNKQFPTSLPPSQHLLHSPYQTPLQPPDVKTQSEAKPHQQLDLLGHFSPPQQHSLHHSSPFSMLPPPVKATELPFQPTLLQQVSHLTQPQFPQSGHRFSPPSSSSLQLPIIPHQPSNPPYQPRQQQHLPPQQIPLLPHNQLQAQGQIPPHQIVQNQSQSQPQGQLPPHQMLQQLQNMQQLQQLQQKLQQQLQEIQQQLQMPQQQQHQSQQPQIVQNQNHQFQSFQQQNQQLQQLLTSVQSASTQPQLQQQIPLHPSTAPELQNIQSLPPLQQTYYQAPQSLALQNSTSQTVIWANSIQPQVVSSATTPVITVSTAANTTQPCSWTEHVSPDGHNYYYNSLTGESRWEKPEELSKQQQQQQQQPQPQPQPQPQLQQLVLPQLTGATLGIGYGQVQSGLTIDSLKSGPAGQQGVQSGQDWALNMKATG